MARFIGGLVAAALWLPAALLLWWTGDVRGQALAFAGLVTSPTVGVVLGPLALVSQDMGAATAILFSVIAVPIGAFAFGTICAILEGRDLLDGIAFGFAGLLVLGLPMLILGINLALVWIVVVRRLASPTR